MRTGGAWLIAAAVLFWVSWLLMPEVGITDAERILELVGQHRARVRLSVVLQLLSAACYAPALAGLIAAPRLGSNAGVRWGATLLLVGAMGSAADAVFHLLAYAMTGVDLDPPVGLMQVVQELGLRFILPLIAAFFAGTLWLSVALARQGVVSGWNPALCVLAFAIAAIGGSLAPHASRTLGLGVLALVAATQAWLGAAAWRVEPSGVGEGTSPVSPAH